MPVKWLILLLCISPAVLNATQENDIELFEFLAMYEEGDIAFIDAEMDDKYESAEFKNEQSLTNQNVTKSESDE